MRSISQSAIRSWRSTALGLLYAAQELLPKLIEPLASMDGDALAIAKAVTILALAAVARDNVVSTEQARGHYPLRYPGI